MKETMSFLDQLMRNNNREWFNAHKAEYKHIQEKFNAFSLKLMEAVAAFDPDVYGLELKDCTYRIYRDIRFSSDKRPYKNHLGCFICKGGKKSGNGGYYFHIEPAEADYIGGNLLAAGMYAPTKELLEHIRHEIIYDGEKLDKAVKKAKNWSFSEYSFLKRVPNGLPKDSEYSDYLRLKDYTLMQGLPDNILFGDEDKLLAYVVKQFKLVKDYNHWLNEAAASTSFTL
ncbi:MAG: DUF2461 domain-containing protein [Bacteroidales bacterium]|nr:DUF2461 domain-containing protein [Bacteroidales bacterium]